MCPLLNYKNKNFPRVLLLGLAVALPAHAEVLTWDASVREAAGNNADVRAARANLDAARFAAQGAYSGFLPQVSAGASRTESSGSLVTTPTANAATVTASQNLFAGFLDSAKVEQAAGSRELAEENLAAAQARLSQDLKSAYAGLLYAQDNVELTARIATRMEENLRLVTLRYEGGRENKGSYLLTKASLAQARYENLQARQALTSAQAQLARVLGRPATEPLSVTDRVPLNEPPAVTDFSALAQQSPAYRQAVAQEKVAAAGVTLARAGFYPSVNLTGSLGNEGAEWYPDGTRRTVGINLTVPLFSGGKDYYATRSAGASLAAAGSGKDSAAGQQLVTLKQNHSAYVASVEKLNVDRAFVEAAETRSAIARSKYNNGLMTFEDWDRIENDLILRQKSFLASQRERVLTEAAWEQAQGKGAIP